MALHCQNRQFVAQKHDFGEGCRREFNIIGRQFPYGLEDLSAEMLQFEELMVVVAMVDH